MGQGRVHILPSWLIRNRLLLGEEGKGRGSQEGVTGVTQISFARKDVMLLSMLPKAVPVKRKSWLDGPGGAAPAVLARELTPRRGLASAVGTSSPAAPMGSSSPRLSSTKPYTQPD